jgi:hypothetical protein
MATPGGTGDFAGPVVGGADEFGRLLHSGNFSGDNRRRYPLTACVSWLRLRVRQVSLWEYDFRQHQSQLLNTLNDMRNNLTTLHSRMARLCEGDDCYLALTLDAFPTTVQGYYGEFLTAYDHLNRILRRYIAYANHYKVKYEKGEMPDEEPEDLQEKLFANFDSLKEALSNLAQELAADADESAGSGQDAPGGPEFRSA